MYSLKKYYPVKTNDLIRVGRNRDGGYVINKRIIDLTKYLVGLGISTDWTFEKSFKSKNKSVQIYAFDFSVSVKDFIKMSRESVGMIFNSKIYAERKTASEKLKVLLYPFFYLKTALLFKNFFRSTQNNTFFKKGVDTINKDGVFINVDEMFSEIFKQHLPEPNSVFLKIDIERSEYNVLPALIKYTDYVNGMVIEFHDLKNYWITFENVMSELMIFYDIVHIHGNNFANYISGTQTPDCLEITLTKKSLITASELTAINHTTYPVKGLDAPCKKNSADIQIRFT